MWAANSPAVTTTTALYMTEDIVLMEILRLDCISVFSITFMLVVFKACMLFFWANTAHTYAFI